MKRTAAVILIILPALLLTQRRPAATPQEPPAEVRSYRVIFGERDTESKTWDGSIDADVVSLTGWRLTDADRIGGKSWKLATRVINLEDQRRGMTEVGQPAIRRLAEAGVVVTVRGPASTPVRVSTAQGDFEFANLGYGRPTSFLSGNVTVERVPETLRLTDDTYEDDYPAPLVTGSGELWVAWTGYRDASDMVLLRRPGEPPVRVSGPGDHQRPALAEDGAGRIWVVWSQNEAQAWHLRARRLESGRWSAVEQITSGEGPNLSPVLAVDAAGDLHLAWQGFRQKRGQILLKTFRQGRWSEEIALSESPGDHWDPSIAADPTGGVWVAWDGYSTGDFQIYARRCREGRPGVLERVTHSRLFSARPSITCDSRGRPWIAWEESGPNWGKDWAVDDRAGTVLYKDRAVRVAALDAGRWREPAGQVRDALSDRMRRFHQLPSIAFDRAGALWMVLRVRTSAVNSREDYWASGGRWEFYVTRLEGGRWMPAVWLPESVGRNGMRASLAPGRNGEMWAVWPTDHRNWPQGRQGPLDVYAVKFDASTTPSRLQLGSEMRETSAAPPPPHPRESDDLRRIREYRLGNHRILRADLHRHTELSGDGGGDGSLEDLYRYEMDAADLDIGHVGDHQMGNDNEYNWWLTQKSNDLYTVPGRFTALYGYERSVWWPNGHRNVVWAERGKPVLKIGPAEAKGAANSGPILYPYLRLTGGIAMSHTSATEQGTDWRDNDPDLEPLVEIYQGFESSYEYAGAPRSWDPTLAKPVHQGQRPAGFIWNAWAKGLKLGVQASSDHVGAHTAYANILTDDPSRKGLVDAMRKRHTYGSTDLIILDYRMDDPTTGPHIMGDIFTTKSTPKILVKIIGTATLQKVDLIRNNQFILTRSPGTREFTFEFVDNQPAPGENYYYVRVIQTDGELAWSSPIWVRYER